MTSRITLISSMATKGVLAELAQAFLQRSGIVVDIESVGGVDAAKRVRSGEAFDLVFLASDAIDRLLAEGHLVGHREDLIRSTVAVAVRAGAPHPDISHGQAVREAVLAAPSLSYSTGPSGTYLTTLFERWGIADQVRSRMVQAPPGVPVGRLVAQGEVALGFQQLSELLPLSGIEVVGELPSDIQFVTTFCAGRGAAAAQACAQAHDAAIAQWLDFLRTADSAAAIRRHGMSPV